MDSLVCDLTNALNSNAVLIKNRKTMRQSQTKKLQNKSKPKLNKMTEKKLRRHNSLNSFRSSSSSSLNPSKITPRRSTTSKIDKHKKIMNLLLAARASINQIQSSEQSKQKFDSDIHNLVRLKQPTGLNSGRTSRAREQPKRKCIKKSKRLRDTKIYKIQKIYRFHSNYRLHCIKLRRLQKKMLRLNHSPKAQLDQEKMSVENTGSSNSSCSSTITTSTTYSSCQTTTDLESSSSLGDCYDDMDNLNINSESDSQFKFKINKPFNAKNKQKPPSKRKLLTYRQRRQFSNSQTSHSSLNLNSVNQKKILTFKRKRINCGIGSSKMNVRRFLSRCNDFETMKTEYEDSNNENDKNESDVDIEVCKNQKKSLDILNRSFVCLKNSGGKRVEQEADDEESSESSFVNNAEIELIPWWNNSNEKECRISSSSSATLTSSSNTALSNYQKLNLKFNQHEQNEFNNILNGALNLMDQSSINNFKNKISFINGEKTKSRRKRYTFPSYENSSNASDHKVTHNEPVTGLPIPETNIGSKMLKNMGWEPGTSLGSIRAQKDPGTLKEPIVALKRPKRVGLGFGAGDKF